MQMEFCFVCVAPGQKFAVIENKFFIDLCFLV